MTELHPNSSHAASIADRIHAEAIQASTAYKFSETSVIDTLQRVEEYRVFALREQSSLFAYATRVMRLDPNVAYVLIAIARAATRVPAIREKLGAGEMTLSNARRVATVITPENQDEWISKACGLTNREFEKEIARVRPQEAVRERVSYATESRMRVELGMSEEAVARLRRAQDLLCQARGRAVSLEETIEVMTDEFLKRRDPVERAKRHQARKAREVARAPSPPVSPSPTDPVDSLVTSRVPPERETIPAVELHTVNLRDQGRCVEILTDGKRCNQSRWVQIHHVIHVSEGGANTADNLITLCSTHHRLRHQGDWPDY